jgi:hypothetical protein
MVIMSGEGKPVKVERIPVSRLDISIGSWIEWEGMFGCIISRDLTWTSIIMFFHDGSYFGSNSVKTEDWEAKFLTCYVDRVPWK